MFLEQLEVLRKTVIFVITVFLLVIVMHIGIGNNLGQVVAIQVALPFVTSQKANLQKFSRDIASSRSVWSNKTFLIKKYDIFFLSLALTL